MPVRSLAWLGLVAIAFGSGCSGGATVAAPQGRHPGPARIARVWSRALNADDNDAAARLFAPSARVIQAGYVLVLRTRAEAVQWNAALPCSGRIVGVEAHGDTATVDFVLGDRRSSRCDGPGRRARAEFRVRDGKIVLWRQLPIRSAPGQVISYS